MSFCIGYTPRVSRRDRRTRTRCTLCNVRVLDIAQHRKTEKHELNFLRHDTNKLRNDNARLKGELSNACKYIEKSITANDELQRQLLTACKYIERSSFTFPRFENPPPPYTTGGFPVQSQTPRSRENPGKRRKISRGLYVPPHRR